MGLRTSVMAVVVLAAPAWAAQDADRPVPRPILRMVEALDADDLPTREQATAELTKEVLRPSIVNAGMITRLIRDPDLSPEQRARLIQVDRAVFPSSPRAAMGIRFMQIGGNLPGVGIQETIPNFPSFEVLRAGDVIITVDGELMRVQNDLRLAILSRDPGDVMELAVERDGEIVNVDCELGYYADLNQQPPTDVLDLALAKRTRRLALIGTESAPVLDARREGAGDAGAGQVRIQNEHTWNDLGRAELAQGGGDRGAPLEQQQFTVRERFDMTRLARQPRVPVRVEQRVLDNDDQVADMFAKQEGILRARMEMLVDRLKEPDLPAPERTELERQIEAVQLQIDSLERIRALERRNNRP